MKKLFFYMAMILAAVVMTTSCSSSDDEGDSTANREKFANALTHNSTSGSWEGWHTTQRKDWGSWYEDGKKYFVVRFDRASNTSITGTGWAYVFENEWKEKFIEKSEFNWRFENDMLHLTFRLSGWEPIYAEYRTTELTINADKFYGYWFEKAGKKYQFNYTKSNFADWNKY